MINWVIYHCGIVLSPTIFFFHFLCNIFCLSRLFALRFHMIHSVLIQHFGPISAMSGVFTWL